MGLAYRFCMQYIPESQLSKVVWMWDVVARCRSSMTRQSYLQLRMDFCTSKLDKTVWFIIWIDPWKTKLWRRRIFQLEIKSWPCGSQRHTQRSTIHPNEFLTRPRFEAFNWMSQRVNIEYLTWRTHRVELRQYSSSLSSWKKSRHDHDSNFRSMSRNWKRPIHWRVRQLHAQALSSGGKNSSFKELQSLTHNQIHWSQQKGGFEKLQHHSHCFCFGLGVQEWY